MSALRILHLGKYYRPYKGGIETVLETLCGGERLAGGEGRAVEPRALVVHKSPHTAHETVDGIPVTRVGSLATIGAVSLAPALPWWLASADADVIVLHEPNPMGLVAYFLARPATPLVIWFHSEVIRAQWKYRLFYEPILAFALRRAARIVVASPPMLDAPALAPYRSKCEVIPYGLDLRRYAPSAQISARAAAMRAGSPLPTLLFVGRLVGYKGVDVLLRALPGVQARAVIVGEGPRRESLEALARELGVDGRVQFAGEATDAELLAWYHACDVFVLPSISRQEAFGMVQLEAMLCERPVVSTGLHTGISWVNQHGRTGLVVPPGDADALREALATLVRDPGLRQRLGEQGRERVLAHFTAETMCAASVALYRSAQASASTAVHGAPVAADRFRQGTR